MATPVEVKVKDHGTYAYLNGLAEKSIGIGKKESWNLTQYGAKAVIQSARDAGIKPWRGKLLTYGTGIEPRKLGEGRYGIFVPIEGIYLDRMSDHYVALKRGRLIYKWAQDKLNKKGGVIFVTKHPYIENGFLNMLNRLELTANIIKNKIGE